MSARRPRAGRRAYTIIEVLIAISLLLIGVGGIIAMQHFATKANRDARMLSMANQIARTWLERLRSDAVQWNHPSPVRPGFWDLTDTQYLDGVLNTDGTADTTWTRPAWNTTLNWGARFDALGNDIPEVDGATTNDTAFCAQYRLTWLYGPPIAAAPPFLVRAEVRVFWPKEFSGASADTLPGSTTNLAALCTDGKATSANLDTETALGTLHFVYAATSLRQNTAVAQ